MSLKPINAKATVFSGQACTTQKEGLDTANTAGFRAVELGFCTQCKDQLLWKRKKFNMGVKILYETCPRCFASSLTSSSLPEAFRQIETLQRNYEDLASYLQLEASERPREISRIQNELEYMQIDIEKIGSTKGIDTLVYENLVQWAETTVEAKISLVIDNARTEPPSLLEQLTELHVDMVRLAQVVKQQQEGAAVGPVPAYALNDVLKQLEQVKASAEQDESSWEQDYQEFHDEINRLQKDLQSVQSTMVNVTSCDVMKLNTGFSSLKQDMERKHFEHTARAKQGEEDLRKRIDLLERQHAAQVEALQAQLSAFMSTTVAAGAVSPSPTGPQRLEQAEVPMVSERDNTFPSTVVEAEIVADDLASSRRSAATTTVDAAGASLTSRRQQTDIITSMCESSVNTSITSDNQGLEALERTNEVFEILQLMGRHQTNALLQALACKKLAALAYNNGEIRTRIGFSGGIDLVLNGMRQFPQDKQVQSHGILALNNISYAHDENKCRIGVSGGVSLVLNNLRQFPNDQQIQRSALLALGNFALDDEIATMISNVGGIEISLRAMRQLPEDEQVQRNGLRALINLACTHKENKTKIGDLGGVESALSAMLRFRENTDVQLHGLHALGNLACNNEKNRTRIGSAGVDLVLQAMRRFPKDAEIQQRGCLTIKALARSTEMRREMKTKGATKVVKKAKHVICDKSCATSTLNALR